MATNSKTKTLAADTKANVTPVVTKAAAVDTTTEKKATVAKTVEAKAADVKAPVKEAKKADTTDKKAPVKKATTAKKPAAKKPAAKKTTAKKADVNAKFILQFSGKEVVADEILENVKKAWVERFQGKLEEIKTIDIYFKPEEFKAYFVVNGLSNGDYYIDL